MKKEKSHFGGRTINEHLLEKRVEAAFAEETHGTRFPNLMISTIDGMHNMLLIFTIPWILSIHEVFPIKSMQCFFLPFSLTWALWRFCWVSWLNYMQCERLHRLIEEEKQEIMENRKEEKEELMELYRQKGLKDKILQEVVDTLMVDDHRCLKIMLEEEFGLTLGIRAHPLQLGCYTAFGSLAAAGISILLLKNQAVWAFPVGAGLILILLSYLLSRYERYGWIPTLIWNLSLFAFSSLSFYFLWSVFL